MRCSRRSFLALALALAAWAVGWCISEQERDGVWSSSVAVAITSIPPRFPLIKHSIRSWLSQIHPIRRLCIFVPRSYKRFRRKYRTTSTPPPPAQTLVAHILQDEDLSRLYSARAIRVVEVEKDWGPATKLVAVAAEHGPSPLCFDGSEDLPRFWLFADDDVGYVEHAVSKYLEAWLLLSLPSSADDVALTNFSEDYRVAYYREGEAEPRVIPHLQAVDTYLIPSAAFLQRRLLSHSFILNAVQFFQASCPESFFQDDYVVSFLLHAAGVRVLSIWTNDNLAVHVEGLSKSHFQMHMDELVFDRETRTKACVHTFAADVLALADAAGNTMQVSK